MCSTFYLSGFTSEPEKTEKRYTYLMTISKRWKIYIDTAERPDAIPLKVVCTSYGEYEITFLRSTRDFIPKQEGYLRLLQSTGSMFTQTIKDVCNFLLDRKAV